MGVKLKTADIVQHAKSVDVLLKHLKDCPKFKLGNFGSFLAIQNKVTTGLKLLNKDADDTVACFSPIFSKCDNLEKPTYC